MGARLHATNTTVRRCAPARGDTAVAGLQYQQYLIVSGTGRASDAFLGTVGGAPHNTRP